MPWKVGKTGNKWTLYLKGKPFSEHKTKKMAVAQMKAIEASKHRKGGANIVVDRGLLNKNDSKYLESDQARYDNWMNDIKARNKALKQKNEDENLMNGLLNPEEEQKKKDLIQRQQKLIQTNPKFRDAYLRQLNERQNNYSNQQIEKNKKEEDRINNIRAYEEEERQAEERKKKASDPWNVIQDTFNSALENIPVVGSVLSTGAKALTGALRGSGKHYCKKCKVFVKSKAQHEKTKKHIGGILGIIKKGYDFVKSKLIRNGYNNKSQATIKEYGNWKVSKMWIYRKPIESALDKALNVISLGQWDKAKGGYDKFFHLGLFCLLNDEKGRFVNVLCEKNATIEITKQTFDVNSFGETQVVYVNKPLTLIQLLDGGQQQLGNEYFKYDAFNGNNCQVFVRALLQGAGLYGSKEAEFVFQPLEEVVKKLPSYVPQVARVITDLGAMADTVMGGKKLDGYELHAVVIRKPATREEAQKISQEFIKNKKKTFIRETNTSFRARNHPKTAFQKGSFRTKRINSKVSLIYGKKNI